MTSKMRKREAFGMTTCVLVLLFCELFFFRNVLANGNMLGDNGDGKLTMLITEHWYHVFRGRARFADLGMFYPAVNTLAYSDMMLGFGLVHSALRFLSMDVFSAYKLTLILVHAVGTFSGFYLLKKVIGTGDMWALFGAMAYSFSDTYSKQMGHPQLIAISLVPLVAVFAVRFFQNLERRKLRNLYALGGIALLVLALYTAWYIAFFSALFASVTLIVWLIVAAVDRVGIKENFGFFLRTVGWDLVGYALFGFVLVIPFLLLELPVMRMSGARSYQEVASFFLPKPYEIIHVSPENWMLGDWIQRLNLDSGPFASEVAEGFSVVLLGVFLGSLLALLTKWRALKTGVLKWRYVTAKALAFAVLVSLALTVKLNDDGASLWQLVYSFFPGAKSIRAVGRYLLFLSVPMGLVTAVMGDMAFGRQNRGYGEQVRYRLGIGLLVVLLFMSNVHLSGVRTAWNREDSRAYVNSVVQPPEDCESFYIVNSNLNWPDVFVQLNACQISDRFGLPTINGYSGVFPEGWSGIDDIDSESYEKSVRDWISKNGIDNIYAFVESENQWVKAEDRVPIE